MTLSQFKSKFVLFAAQAAKGRVSIDEYDKFDSQAKHLRLTEDERIEFNRIMKRIKDSGCIKYRLPKISKPSVHTVPNRIG